mgnify:CR=1 FL=1
MKCPNCNEKLVMSERQGIEIDYCPECRGVWLDKGELDKIIERSVSVQETQKKKESDKKKKKKYEDDEDDEDGGFFNRMSRNEENSGRKKGGGFLSDLFDFG